MSQNPTRQTILVVDDETLIRMSAVASLEDAGFWVLEAKDSIEALEMLGRHDRVSVLMTDVRMPGVMDGLALVTRVRRDHPTVRPLIVSGNSSAEAAGKAGAFGYLSKPYMAQTMVQAVRDTLLRH